MTELKPFQPITETNEEVLEVELTLAKCPTCEIRGFAWSIFGFLVLLLLVLGFTAATAVIDWNWYTNTTDTVHLDFVSPLVACLALAMFVCVVWILYVLCDCCASPLCEPFWEDDQPGMCFALDIPFFCSRPFVISIFALFTFATLLTFGGFLYMVTWDSRNVNCLWHDESEEACLVASTQTSCGCYWKENTCNTNDCIPRINAMKSVGPVLFLVVFIIWVVLGLSLRQRLVKRVKEVGKLEDGSASDSDLGKM